MRGVSEGREWGEESWRWEEAVTGMIGNAESGD